MAKISRHRLNLKGKATMMEKENHRNGGRQDAPKPVEGKMKISLKVHDREADKFLLSFFGGGGGRKHIWVSEVTAWEAGGKKQQK